jgi:hypothetical protein
LTNNPILTKNIRAKIPIPIKKQIFPTVDNQEILTPAFVIGRITPIGTAMK